MALKEFQDLWLNNIAVITTDNTTVVACLKKECVCVGGGGGGEFRPSLCPTMENPDLVFQETGNSSPTHSRRLYVIADKLSSLIQTRQSRQNGHSCQVFPNNMLLVAPGLKWVCFFPPGSTTNGLNLHHWGQIPQYGQ